MPFGNINEMQRTQQAASRSASTPGYGEKNIQSCSLGLCNTSFPLQAGGGGGLRDSPALSGWVHAPLFWAHLCNPPGSVFYCLEHNAERTCVMVVPQTLHHWAAELQGPNAPLVEITSSSANYNICYKCCQESLNFTPCCSSVVGCAMLFINTSWIFWTNQP